MIITTVTIIIVSIGLSTSLLTKWEIKSIEDKIENNLLNAGISIANTPFIQKQLYYKNSVDIQKHIILLLGKLVDTEIITVADMSGLRYAHPNPERIGEYFVGGDEVEVLTKGKIYKSIATGTLGRSIRVFVPIYYKETQVGFVMTGHLYTEVIDAKNSAYYSFIIYSIIGVIVGAIGAIIFSIYTKKILLGLEPKEIAMLYNEKRAMLSSLSEGILAIDENGFITEINASALKILNTGESRKRIIGRDIQEVFPESLLLDIVEGEKEINYVERTFNGTPIVSNFSPILIDGKIKGAIATFRDRSKVVHLAEEITGVNLIVDALRANTHEFLNKLHLIHGLLELGKTDEAKEYIISTSGALIELQDITLKNIKNSTICALLVGKFNRSKELTINFSVDQDSTLSEEHTYINNENLVTIIGNLIDNGMDAIIKKGTENGYISVFISDKNDMLIIEIADNGVGIEDNLDIFKKGVSTKVNSGGTGLFLVKNIVDNYKGDVEYMSANSLTTFTVTIPLGGTDD